MKRLLSSPWRRLSLWHGNRPTRANLIPWRGTVNSMSQGRYGPQCPTFQGTVQMFIENGAVVRGRAETPNGTPPIHGLVRDDGAFRGTIGRAAMTGKFSGDAFIGAWAFDSMCSANVTLTRAH